MPPSPSFLNIFPPSSGIEPATIRVTSPLASSSVSNRGNGDKGSSVLPVSVQSNERTCNLCKKARIPSLVSYPYVRCEPCREKSNQWSKLSLERKRQREMAHIAGSLQEWQQKQSSVSSAPDAPPSTSRLVDPPKLSDATAGVASVPNSTIAEDRTCSGCKRAQLPPAVDYPYKQCEACREKGREHSRLFHEKRKQKEKDERSQQLQEQHPSDSTVSEDRACSCCKRAQLPPAVDYPYKQCEVCREKKRIESRLYNEKKKQKEKDERSQQSREQQQSTRASPSPVSTNSTAAAPRLSSDSRHSMIPLSSLTGDGGSGQARFCSGCNTTILPSMKDYPFKLCEVCRARGRESERRKMEKKRAKAEGASQAPTHGSSVEMSSLKRKRENDGSENNPKKKSKTDGSEKSYNSTVESYTDYQTSSMLLEDVKASREGTFMGRYSIIAANDVDHKQRIKLVCEQLKETGVQWHKSSRSAKHDHDGKWYKVSYDCKCQKDCGGRIKVRATDDDSHLAFRGQRIVVEIRH